MCLFLWRQSTALSEWEKSDVINLPPGSQQVLQGKGALTGSGLCCWPESTFISLMLPSPCWTPSIPHGSIVQAVGCLRRDIHRLGHFSHMITKDLLWTRYLQVGIYVGHNYLHTMANPRGSSTYLFPRSYARNCPIMFFSKSLTSILVYIYQAISTSKPNWQLDVPTEVQWLGETAFPLSFRATQSGLVGQWPYNTEQSDQV